MPIPNKYEKYGYFEDQDPTIEDRMNKEAEAAYIDEMVAQKEAEIKALRSGKIKPHQLKTSSTATTQSAPTPAAPSAEKTSEKVKEDVVEEAAPAVVEDNSNSNNNSTSSTSTASTTNAVANAGRPRGRFGTPAPREYNSYRYKADTVDMAAYKKALEANLQDYAEAQGWNSTQRQLFYDAFDNYFDALEEGRLSTNRRGAIVDIDGVLNNGLNPWIGNDGNLYTDESYNNLSRRQRRKLDLKNDFFANRQVASYLNQVAKAQLQLARETGASTAVPTPATPAAPGAAPVTAPGAPAATNTPAPSLRKFNLDTDGFLGNYLRYLAPSGQFDNEAWANTTLREKLNSMLNYLDKEYEKDLEDGVDYSMMRASDKNSYLSSLKGTGSDTLASILREGDLDKVLRALNKYGGDPSLYRPFLVGAPQGNGGGRGTKTFGGTTAPVTPTNPVEVVEETDAQKEAINAEQQRIIDEAAEARHQQALQTWEKSAHNGKSWNVNNLLNPYNFVIDRSLIDAYNSQETPLGRDNYLERIKNSLADNLNAQNLSLDVFRDNQRVSDAERVRYIKSLYNALQGSPIEFFRPVTDGDYKDWVLMDSTLDRRDMSVLVYNPATGEVKRTFYGDAGTEGYNSYIDEIYKLIQSNARGGLLKFQEGGLLYSEDMLKWLEEFSEYQNDRSKKTSSNRRLVRTGNKEDNKYSEGFDGWSTTEAVRLGAIVADLSALVDPEPITALALGVGSDITNLWADLEDGYDNATAWGNFAANLGLSALGTVPIIGDAVGSGGKIMKALVKLTPKLGKCLTLMGITELVTNGDEILHSLSKIGKDGVENELNLEDWRNIQTAIEFALGGIQGGKNTKSKKALEQIKADKEVVDVQVRDKKSGKTKVLRFIDEKDVKAINEAGTDHTKVNEVIQGHSSYNNYEVLTSDVKVYPDGTSDFKKRLPWTGEKKPVVKEGAVASPRSIESVQALREEMGSRSAHPRNWFSSANQQRSALGYEENRLRRRVAESEMVSANPEAIETYRDKYDKKKKPTEDEPETTPENHPKNQPEPEPEVKPENKPKNKPEVEEIPEAENKPKTEGNSPENQPEPSNTPTPRNQPVDIQTLIEDAKKYREDNPYVKNLKKKEKEAAKKRDTDHIKDVLQNLGIDTNTLRKLNFGERPRKLTEKTDLDKLRAQLTKEQQDAIDAIKKGYGVYKEGGSIIDRVFFMQAGTTQGGAQINRTFGTAYNPNLYTGQRIDPRLSGKVSIIGITDHNDLLRGSGIDHIEKKEYNYQNAGDNLSSMRTAWSTDNNGNNRVNDIVTYIKQWKQNNPNGNVNGFLKAYNTDVDNQYSFINNLISEGYTGKKAYDREDEGVGAFNTGNRRLYSSYNTAGQYAGWNDDQKNRMGTSSWARGLDITDNAIEIALGKEFNDFLEGNKLVKIEDGRLALERETLPEEPPIVGYNVNSETEEADKKGSKTEPKPDKSHKNFNIPDLSDLIPFLHTLNFNDNLDTKALVNLGIPLERFKEEKGDLAAIQDSERKAAKLNNIAARSATADSAQNRAALLDASEKGNEIRNTGHMADNQALEASKNEVDVVNRENAVSRWQSATQNLDHLFDGANSEKAAKAAQKRANYDSTQQFMKDQIVKLRAEKAKKDARELEGKILSSRYQVEADPRSFGIAMTDEEEDLYQRFENGLINPSTLTETQYTALARIKAAIQKKQTFKEAEARLGYSIEPQKPKSTTSSSYDLLANMRAQQAANTGVSTTGETGTTAFAKGGSVTIRTSTDNKAYIQSLKNRVKELEIYQKHVKADLDRSEKQLERMQKAAENYSKSQKLRV